jgi:hypothetical protein
MVKLVFEPPPHLGVSINQSKLIYSRRTAQFCYALENEATLRLLDGSDTLLDFFKERCKQLRNNLLAYNLNKRVILIHVEIRISE